MYGKFVGLDIGTETIKAALIKRGLRDVVLLGTWEIKTPSDESAIPIALRNFFEDHALPTQDVAVSAFSSPISIRVLKFPFWNPKKVEMVYKFELENVSTFNPDEKLHAYHLIKLPEGKSEALVCMFEKDAMEEILSITPDSGLDPKIVTHTPLALSALEEYVGDKRPCVIVNIADGAVHYALFDTNGIRRVRSSNIGDESINEALSSPLGSDREKVDEVKRQGMDGENAETLKDALAPLIEDIKKTVRFFDLDIREKAEIIKLTGAGSQIMGLTKYISSELELPVEDLIIPELGGKTAEFAQCYSLALYGGASSNQSLNLRKDEFSFKGKSEEIKKVFGVPAVLFSIILILSLYTSCGNYFKLKKEVGIMEGEIEKIVKGTFPNMPVIVNPKQLMQDKLNEMNENLQLFEDIMGGTTPLDVIKELSTSIPYGLVVKIDDIALNENGRGQIKGKCNTYDDVAKIEKALADSDTFKEVKIVQTDIYKKEKIVFTISFIY